MTRQTDLRAISDLLYPGKRHRWSVKSHLLLLRKALRDIDRELKPAEARKQALECHRQRVLARISELENQQGAKCTQNNPCSVAGGDLRRFGGGDEQRDVG